MNQLKVYTQTPDICSYIEVNKLKPVTEGYNILASESLRRRVANRVKCPIVVSTEMYTQSLLGTKKVSHLPVIDVDDVTDEAELRSIGKAIAEHGVGVAIWRSSHTGAWFVIDSPVSSITAGVKLTQELTYASCIVSADDRYRHYTMHHGRFVMRAVPTKGLPYMLSVVELSDRPLTSMFKQFNYLFGELWKHPSMAELFETVTVANL